MEMLLYNTLQRKIIKKKLYIRKESLLYSALLQQANVKSTYNWEYN